MIGFMNVSLPALTRALLQHPVDAFRGLSEVVQGDPEIFADLGRAFKDRVEWEFREGTGLLRAFGDIESFLRGPKRP